MEDDLDMMEDDQNLLFKINIGSLNAFKCSEIIGNYKIIGEVSSLDDDSQNINQLKVIHPVSIYSNYIA